MRLEQLEYLVEINKTRSINAASENLNLTHQSLNRALKNLENELGVTLLSRSAKGVSLTDEGKRVLSTAEEVLSALELLKSDLAATGATLAASDNLKGLLSIAISPVASAMMLPTYSDAFSKRHPLVNLFIQEVSPTEVVQRVMSGHSEIGLANLRRPDMKRRDDSLMIRTLAQDQAVVLVGKDSPLAQNKSVSLKTIIDYPFILYCTDPQREHWIFPYLASMGKSIKRYMYTNSLSIMVDNIASGSYISFFSQKHFQLLKESMKKDLAAIPLRNKVEREELIFYLVLLTQKDMELSRPAQAFIKMLF